MSYSSEWEELFATMRQDSVDHHFFTNQFYRKLLLVIKDVSASTEDKLVAYYDALRASPSSSQQKLPSKINGELNRQMLADLGLIIDRQGYISLDVKKDSDTIIDWDDLKPIYELTPRRTLKQYPIDPALKSLLNNDEFEYYNGKAQRDAVRVAITAKPGSTIVINLPTGSGKTLVMQALCLDAPSTALTIVIVPTISLSIDQSERIKEVLKKANQQTHDGPYCWHHGQTREEHRQIRTRIENQTQKILFCSPESILGALLPVLFRVSEKNGIANFVVDEAHMIDQWGAAFRPEFQSLASLVRSLRKSGSSTVKCILMSATFTQASFKVVKDLFDNESHEFIHVNGCFLRPEIQYHVAKVRRDQHDQKVKKAVLQLAKPMIVYTVMVADADNLFNQLRNMGLTRIGLWTGERQFPSKDELISQWQNDELDIVIATSAFGLGIDKQDVRTVLHVAIPENLDRFYQEVGRGGRDGLASQSLVLFYPGQRVGAQKLMGANKKRVTLELGLKKWKAMWNHGKPSPGGKRKLDVTTIRPDQTHLTDENEKWNWRTLSLMQRSGIVQLDLDSPDPPKLEGEATHQDHQKEVGQYYDKYWREVIVTPLNDQHLTDDVWNSTVLETRNYEQQAHEDSLKWLIQWLEFPNENKLCDTLLKYYSVDDISPSYACGGCPSCRQHSSYIQSPSVGTVSRCDGLEVSVSWQGALNSCPPQQYVYYELGDITDRQFVRNQIKWLTRLIDDGSITSICATPKMLKTVSRALKSETKKFWIGEYLRDNSVESSLWPQLVLCSSEASQIPRIGFTSSPILIIAPKNIKDTNHSGREWWESKQNAVSLTDMKNRI